MTFPSLDTISNPDQDAAREAHELISFRAGGQEFCVDVIAVREIRGWTATTPLPQSPDYVSGVINLRGAVLPVVDLSARLGLGPTDPTRRSVIIVVQIGTRLVGVLVDGVSDILSIARDEIQPAPDISCEIVSDFVNGIVSIDGRLMSWILLERILPDTSEAVA